ncbi:MAG: hypothetical protein D6730_14660 [Bacteroidetes bacterium]|nr:MAG: hypothetical protein D6730_14660 [Bacteroidota bacterium]
MIQSLLDQLSAGTGLEIQGEYYQNLVRELHASVSQLRKLQDVLVQGLRQPQPGFRHIKITKSTPSQVELAEAPAVVSSTGSIKIRRRD